MSRNILPWWVHKFIARRWLFIFSLVGLLVLGAGAFWLQSRVDDLPATTGIPPMPDCTGARDTQTCHDEHYTGLVYSHGTKTAIESLRSAYDTNVDIQSNCHQLTHAIGRAAAKIYPNVADAHAQGDQICWSGYYHGVMETIISQIGSDKVAQQIDTICAGVSEGQRYSFYHYNCVHGLGHGAMLITSHELFQALDLCDKLSDGWEQSSCWGGAFMENIMADTNVLHDTKYLYKDQPLYPCTAVAEKYKEECYKMQTSYALNVMDGSFSRVFALCGTVEEPHRATCYQSLGRDASGRSISQVEQTRTSCMIGPDYESRSNCVMGAVRDFISYYHSDTQAKEFCASLEADLQTICTTTAENYYTLF